MLVFQREAQCPGIHQFVLRNRIPFQLLSAGCHLFDINIFRGLRADSITNSPFG